MTKNNEIWEEWEWEEPESEKLVEDAVPEPEYLVRPGLHFLKRFKIRHEISKSEVVDDNVPKKEE